MAAPPDWRALFGSIGRHPSLRGILAATFALGFAFSFVAPFLSIWGTQAVGLSPTAFGLFMTVTTLSAIVVSTSLARWSDTRLARRTVLIWGALGGAIGYAGYGLVREPLLLLLIGASFVAVASVCFSQLFAHVREQFARPDIPAAEAGFIMSLVRVCFSVAWTVGPAMGAWVMVRYDLRGVFLGAAALYVLFLIGILRFVPHSPPRSRTHRTPPPPIWRVLTRRDLMLSFAAFVAVFAAYAMNMMTLPLLVTQVLGGTGSQLGIILGIGPLAEIPLMLWFGQLAARGHQRRLLYLGAVFTALYFAALTQVQAPWHIYPMQVLSGASFAILTNVAILYFQDLIPEQPGLATNVFANSSNLGNLSGYFAFGPLFSYAGPRGIFVAGAILALGTLTLLIASRPTRPVSPARQSQFPESASGLGS